MIHVNLPMVAIQGSFAVRAPWPLLLAINEQSAVALLSVCSLTAHVQTLTSHAYLGMILTHRKVRRTSVNVQSPAS